MVLPLADRMRILAVVVTCNRELLLSRCLDHLQGQTRQLGEIIVIDNGSTDGTLAMLRARGVRFVTQDNDGSAGGWHRGIQMAVDEGFDAVWLMDDDGYPDHSALEALERAWRPDTICAASIVLRENDPSRFVFPFPLLNRNGLPVTLARHRKVQSVAGLKALAPDGTYPFAHFFNGALISVAGVRQVGNVDQGFVLFGDEVDYFFRLRRAGAVYSVLAARHFHPDVTQRPYTAAKIYYYIKNTFILHRRYFDHVPARNLGTIVAAIGRTVSRNGLADGFSYVAGANARVFYRAIARGLRGRVGRDFGA